MVKEGRALIAVGHCTGSLHTVGHAWGSAGEDSNLGQQEVLLLEAVKELVEVRPTKVSDSTQSCEQTAS